MSYIKTSWVARVGTALNRFLKTNETSTEVELTNDPTGVSVPGTPFTVANMNKIEQGIYDAHEALGDNIDELTSAGNPTFAGLNGFNAVITKYKTMLSSFASPGEFPYGLAFNGTNLISCDHGTDLIYIHNGISSTILSSFASPGTNPSGLTFDGTNLISCDSDTDRIYIHDGISATISSSFASPRAFPSGLAFDGNNLISCDVVTDLIYIHNGISATISSSFASHISSPSGLAFNGTNLISCDYNTDLIYVHADLLEFVR